MMLDFLVQPIFAEEGRLVDLEPIFDESGRAHRLPPHLPP